MSICVEFIGLLRLMYCQLYLNIIIMHQRVEQEKHEDLCEHGDDVLEASCTTLGKNSVCVSVCQLVFQSKDIR